MNQAFICDAIRTPFGRYGGALSSVRTDDLGAVPLRALMARNPHVDGGALTDVLFGGAHQLHVEQRLPARNSEELVNSAETILRIGDGLHHRLFRNKDRYILHALKVVEISCRNRPLLCRFCTAQLAEERRTFVSLK